MSFNRKFFIFGLSFIFLAFLVGFCVKNYQEDELPTVILGEKVYTVEIMDDDIERSRGLSFHSPLSDNQGMLFIFEEDDLHGFWMKDMGFPIDIIWIDKNLQIVHIEKEVLPVTYPKIFSPTTPARYILELSAGQSDILKLKTGDTIKILKNY